MVRAPDAHPDTHPLLHEGEGTEVTGRSSVPPPARSWAGRELHPRQIGAAALVAAGLIAIFVGWFGVSGTSEVWEQIPYLISGGIGGSALVILGVATYVSYEHVEDRRRLTELIKRIDELELGLAGEFDALGEQLNGTRDPAKARRRG